MLQAKTKEQQQKVIEIFGERETNCHFPLDYDRENVGGYEKFNDRLYLDGDITFDKMAEIVDYLRSIQPKKETLDLSIVAPEMREAVETWLAYKREKKQTYKPSGFSTFYKRLCKLSNNNPQVAMAIVEESMSNNYAGIFPLKNGNSNYGRPKTNTEKFYDTIQSANEFSQKLHERVGNQAEMGNGDSDTLW